MSRRLGVQVAGLHLASRLNACICRHCTWRLLIYSALFVAQSTAAVKVEVVFAHTPTYPEEPPLLKARG